MCRICHLNKEEFDFSKDKKIKDGFKNECKLCVKEMAKKYRENNREILKQKKKDRYRKNIESERKIRSLKYQQNIESAREKGRINYWKNRDVILIKQKERYQRDADKRKSYNQQNKVDIDKKTKLRRQNIEYKYRSWKKGAEKRGIEWSLDIDYLKSLPLKCFYTNELLTFEVKKINTISLDRVDNSKGYVVGNVVFCCWYINEMKSDYTLREFLQYCEIVFKNKENILKKVKNE